MNRITTHFPQQYYLKKVIEYHINYLYSADGRDRFLKQMLDTAARCEFESLLEIIEQSYPNVSDYF